MNDMNKIAVIGTVFMDIKGFSHNSYDPVGTNIGDIVFSFGGVGRNAAENLANIGIPVSFLYGGLEYSSDIFRKMRYVSCSR